MMTKKKWLIVAALGAALCLVATVVAVVVIVWFIGLDTILGFLGLTPANLALPVYTFEQTDSAHSGYRHTTITSGTTVYVQDYEETALLACPSPTNAIGRAAFGGGQIYPIPGQPPAAYVAVDCGSEMPAYEVFRNRQHPPFDWRTAKFQSLEFAAPIGRTEHKRTTDPAVIEDMLRTLREGTSTELSVVVTNLSGVFLISDQLPGLIFCPYVYRDEAGPVYLTLNPSGLAVASANSTQVIPARWIPASPLFTKWVHTP